MADVVITLSLARKSGILAAAVSAINRAGLHFSSHRFIEVSSGHQIRLRADSEGEFGDPRGVIDELSGIRGVESVLDVVVDGRSLLNPEPEPEPETVPEQEQEQEPEPEPEPESEPESAPEPQPERDDSTDELPDPGDKDPDEEEKTADPGGQMRPSMVRRRRRRR